MGVLDIGCGVGCGSCSISSGLCYLVCFYGFVGIGVNFLKFWLVVLWFCWMGVV